jgi:hypothetical protein
MLDTGLASDGSAWYGPEGGGPIDPSRGFRFGLGTTKDCPVGGRAARKKEDLVVGDKIGEGEGGEGWLSFFLNILLMPNIFFGPLVGVELLSVRVIFDASGDAGSVPPDESERADDAGVCTPSGPPGRGAACKIRSWCSSRLVRLLDGGNREVDAV